MLSVIPSTVILYILVGSTSRDGSLSVLNGVIVSAIDGDPVGMPQWGAELLQRRNWKDQMAKQPTAAQSQWHSSSEFVSNFRQLIQCEAQLKCHTG